MPYRGEHSARIQSPKNFKDGTFRSKPIAKGIRLILGKTCDECPMETQAVRFDSCQFSVAEVKAWLKEHDMRPLKIERARDGCKE